MYSKHEKAKLSEAFWTAFGRYMSPLKGANGKAINWINYKTGVRHIIFRTEVHEGMASVGIELTHPNPSERQQAWVQFQEVKHLLEQEAGEEWIWALQVENEYGTVSSKIYTTLTDVNMYEQEKWPALISFFKPRLMALDAFWEQVKYSFEI